MRDSYNLSGRQRKEELDLNYEEALTLADEDIDENGEEDRSAFLLGGYP